MSAGCMLAWAVVAAASAPGAAGDARGGDSQGADKTLAVRLERWRYQAGPPPAGWAESGFDDSGWAGPDQGPFAPRLPLPVSGGVLVPVPVGARAVTRYQHVAGAPLLLRSRFAVTDAARVRVLELRVAYADGFVAFVNGKEVARRGLSVDGVATAPHGPEIERVFVALPLPGLDLRPDDNMIALAVYAMPGRSAAVPVAPAASVTVAAAA